MKWRCAGVLSRPSGHDRRPAPPTPPITRAPKAALSPPVTDRPPTISLDRSWAALSILGRHLWPKGEWGLRARVIAGLLLLVLAKLTNVYVPILYKHAVDGLGDKAQVVA